MTFSKSVQDALHQRNMEMWNKNLRGSSYQKLAREYSMSERQIKRIIDGVKAKHLSK